MKPVVLAFALLLFSCRSERLVNGGKPAPGAIVPGETADNSNTLFAAKPFRHCLANPAAIPSGKIEVLVDASGSMTSVRTALPRLVSWVDLAVSRLRASALNIDRAELCEFSSRIGIAGCSPSLVLRKDFRGSGNTNLHAAIRRTTDNAVTFILTDGVAAAGTTAQGDCATAVDAACVARALRDAVHPTGETRGQSHRGVWLVPVISPHDGVYYTEKQIPLAAFDSEATNEQIRTDMNTDVTVQDPRVDAGERLNFVYRGPRVLLILVIANDAEIGRAAVAALVDAQEQSDVEHLSSLKSYVSGIGAFVPLELYPGLAVPVAWEQAEEADEQAVGTIEARLQANTLYVDCKQGEVSELTQILAATARAGPRQSRCVDIWSFPGFNYRLHAVKPDTDQVLASFITSYTVNDPLASTSELALRIRCDADQMQRPCSTNPMRTQYTAAANYVDTSKVLEDDKHVAAPATLVKSISTLQPQREPHRVYALGDTLRIFYDELAEEQYNVSLAQLAICHDDGKGR
jgi:hypothetical protein